MNNRVFWLFFSGYCTEGLVVALMFLFVWNRI